MAVRSRRLFGPTQLSTSLTVIYTVPADRTAIVRTTWLYNQSASPVTVLLTVNGTGVADRLANLEVPAQRERVLLGDLVLNPGDVLRGAASVAGVANILMAGSLLLGAPE